MKGVSVILCCYNSSQRLPKTLEYLSKQQFPAFLTWEVVVVDNNSTDETGNVAVDTWRRLNVETPLVLTFEGAPGLSHARKKGAEMAKYEYLIFCDDDNWLFDNYVAQAYQTLSSNEKIGVVGGEGFPVADIEFPAWFSKRKRMYAVGDQEGNARVNVVYGAGMVLRRSIFHKIYDQLPPLTPDRVGKKLIGGGDDEICYRFKILGFDIFFDHQLKFYHYIPAARLTEQYTYGISSGSGYSKMLLMPYFYFFNKDHSYYAKLKYLWIKEFFYLLKELASSRDKHRMIHLLGSMSMILKYRSEYDKMVLSIYETFKGNVSLKDRSV